MTSIRADRTRAVLKHLSQGTPLPDQVFAPGRVIIRVGRDAARLPHGQLICSCAVNLVSRLFPVVQDLTIVVPELVNLSAPVPRWGARTLQEHLTMLLNAVQPEVAWRMGSAAGGHEAVELVIGSAEAQGASVVYLGGDGWQLAVSPHQPRPIGHSLNPVGAYTAACLGVGEVWKHLLQPHRNRFRGSPIIPLTETLHFSALTYRARPGEPNPAIPASLAVDRLTIAGLGAGGGAAAFTLATLPDLAGVLNLIEPDGLEPTNLNRYLYADLSDALEEKGKTEVVGSLFARFANLRVRAIHLPFREAVPLLGAEDFRYLLAAVHSREGRRDIQWETPMVLWDAAAEEGEFGLWRMVFGRTECMWCKHPPADTDPERAKALQLTALLGLDPDTWLRKIRDNLPFTEAEVRALTLPPGAQFDLPMPGQRFADWERLQCGRLRLAESDGAVPVPFAPVLAGVLVAGEVVKQLVCPEYVLDSYYWNTVTGRFMRRNVPTRRLPRPGCSACEDGDLRAQYTRRWRQA